jgi:hypothetical protein
MNFFHTPKKLPNQESEKKMSAQTKSPGPIAGRDIVTQRLLSQGYRVPTIDRYIPIPTIPTYLETKFQLTTQNGLTRIFREILGGPITHFNSGRVEVKRVKPRLKIIPIWRWITEKKGKN